MICMATINMGDLKQRFQERQYKLTPQRQIVLQAFVDNPGKHLSAEDVHNIVRKQSAEIGLATVYRTLELLSDMDVLQKMDFGDGRSRYEINEDSSEHHHHHLICLSCGTVKEFEDDLLETLETVIARKSNFKIVDHQVKFYGYCDKCQSSRED
ncbi:Fur family transcriptional regulator, ferric uptake regulator [Dendrosporobacter quercicolus]|uniref:Fur family transcriptional regulator, ferric uptake regulator n=2 Tax=Dendrosporobacter quercicolus TaxID=146817 RepID=A0A1G9KS91_9FIRM|nr:Fur family transcriptional regulator, ferric uptake regulator [Dendrosporobacter quercicolus]